MSLSPFWRENKGIPPEEVKHITCADIVSLRYKYFNSSYCLQTLQDCIKANGLDLKINILYLNSHD